MDFLLPLIIAIVIFAGIAKLTHAILKLRTVVPTNMVHIVQSRLGATSYGRNNLVAGNVYYAWPSWIPKIGVNVIQLPESVFNINLKAYDAYDSNRLPFVVDIAAFVRISDSSLAAQRIISEADLRLQLQQIIQGAVRRILATNTLEEIMEARSGLGKQFTDEVEAQLEQWGVTTVKTIEFMDIRDSADSQVIENIMRKEVSRIDRESRIAVAENERAAENAEIDKAREIALREQEKLQQVGIRTASQEQAVGIEREKAQQAVQEEAKNTAEKLMDVQRVQIVRKADIEKESKAIQAEMERNIKVTAAQASKETMLLDAEANKVAIELQASADLTRTQMHAQGVAAEGTAVATAEQQMLMAPVNAQIALAEKIGESAGYQTYLITIEKVKAERDIGIEMAKAMGHAKMTVVASSGDIKSGTGSIMDMFSQNGGSKLAGMFGTLSGTPEGKEFLDSVTSRIGGAHKKSDAE